MDRSIYRDWVRSSDLVKTAVSYKETDLCIMAERVVKEEALVSIRRYRDEIEGYIKQDPIFKESLKPIKLKGDPPAIVEKMAKAANLAHVGPMAAVAGAIAEAVGQDLLAYSKEMIVENGGDIFIASKANRTCGVFAGDSPLTGKLHFEIMHEDMPLGISTSSGSVGPSLSLGKADAATVIAKDCALSDALATQLGNMVSSKEDIEVAIDFAKKIQGVLGVFIIVGDKIGTWGKIRLGT